MSGETFGQMLARMRQAKVVTVVWVCGGSQFSKTGPMSQNELARRSGVNAGEVHRLEKGERNPSSAMVETLAETLQLDESDRARLLISAGYWPWDLRDDEVTAVLRAVREVTDLDWRATG